MMFCCYHDPGLALFLAESPAEPDFDERALAWIGLVSAALLAFVSLALLA